MVRACLVVNRQLNLALAKLRSASQGLMFLCKASSSAFRPLRLARASTLNSVSAMFN